MNLLAPLSRLADNLRYRRHADIGKRGEDQAHRYLRRKGYIIVARNWRPPQGGGEIDLIACEPSPTGDTIVFVEVKSRSSDAWNSPLRNIDADKLLALRRAARDYIRRSRADASRARFDVIAITGSSVEHLQNAFPML